MASAAEVLGGLKTRRSQFTQQQIALPVVVVVTGLLVLGPLLVLLKASLTPGAALPFDSWASTLENYAAAYSAPDTYRLAINTVWYASGSVAVGLVIASVMAFLAERTDI